MNPSKYIATGVVFATIWGSAGVANKIGLKYGQPLWMTNTRFLISATLLMLFVHGIKRMPLPARQDYKPLMIYGVLVNAIYMSLFIYGVKEASAGISTLALVMNPLIINILSAYWYKKPVRSVVWIGLSLGITGVCIATWPLLQGAQVTLHGMSFLAASMLCYSIGTVYYAHREWHLPKLVINTWQIFFGAVLLLPLSLTLNDISLTNYTTAYWGAVLWMAIPVTIVAVQLWLILLSYDTSKATLWLFLCPVFGFFYSWLMLNEPITLYTVTGTALVLAGLYIGVFRK
jgi:probable blue pigment (indigoidine) exporter